MSDVPQELEDFDLIAYWSDEANDFVMEFPEGQQPDGGLIYSVLGQRREGLGNVNAGGMYQRTSLALELERRGHDPKTLRFGIKTRRS